MHWHTMPTAIERRAQGLSSGGSIDRFGSEFDTDTKNDIACALFSVRLRVQFAPIVALG